jgi:hypothetical protein
MDSSSSIYPPAYANDPEVIARLQMQGQRAQLALKKKLESLPPAAKPSTCKAGIDNERLAARYKQRKMQAPLQQPAQEPISAFQAGSNTILADMSKIRAQARIQTIGRMAEIAANTNAHVLRMQVEIEALQEQKTDSSRYDAEFCQRAEALKASIRAFAADRPHSGPEFERHIVAIKQAMDNFEASIAAMSAQATERFQESVAEVQNKLNLNEKLHSHLDELAYKGIEAIYDDIAVLMQKLLALQDGDVALNKDFNHLQEGISDLQIHMQNDVENLQKQSMHESIQHELELLQEMLDQESQPALKSIMSFYSQMREAFAADLKRVEDLSMDDQFQTLQERIISNSLDVLERELTQLEQGCEALQAQIDALPVSIAHIREMQVQISAGIENVKKILKQQKKAMRQGMLKTIALGATAIMTGGSTLALVNLALNISGLEGKINQLTHKFVQPIAKPLVRVLKPIMAPINKICAPVTQTLAPITQFLGYLNAVQGSVSILNSGGSWQQAGLTIAQNVAPQPGQFARTLFSNPLDSVMREVMKEAAPVLATIQDVKSIMGSADMLVNSLTSAAGALPFSDGDCMGGFVGDIKLAAAQTTNQPTATVQELPSQSQAKVEAPLQNQWPLPKQSIETKGYEPSCLKPAAQAPAKGERTSSGKLENKTSNMRPQLAAKATEGPMKATSLPQKAVAGPELFRGHGGALCTKGDIMIATNAMNNLDEKYGVGAQIINGFRKDIKWGCAAENIQGPAMDVVLPAKPAISQPAIPVKMPVVEMSIYRTAQANLNPLMPFRSQARVDEAMPNKIMVPTANLGDKQRDCSWWGHVQAGIGKIGADEMAKMSPDKFYPKTALGAIKATAHIIKGKAPMADPEDDNIVGKIKSFGDGWQEHRNKCKTTMDLDNKS